MLEVRRLEKVIEQRSALAVDEWRVGAGEVVAVVGPARSGKTLLVRLLCGDLAPSGGAVLLDGQEVHRSAAARARIGVLFEEDLLYERQSAQQNLDFVCALHRLPRARVAAALAQVGLSDQAQLRLERLSPTAQRRLAFARLLVAQPSLWLLDQPTLRADLPTQALFARLLRQAASDGAAVILTDEHLAWAATCCTRVVALDEGRIVRDAPHEAAREADPPAQFIPPKVPARREDRIVLYDPGELLYATSRDGKTFLHTATEEALTPLTLQELESRLAGRGFFKAHRAYLVNLQHIKAVIQYTRNSYSLLLNDGQDTMIPLSKQSEKELQALLGY